MARLMLVTGGGRSGKSRYAQAQAEALGRERVYVATCPQLDAELTARIQRHRRERAGRGWRTVEEEVELAAALRREPGEVVLVDCLTLWINNLMYAAAQEGQELAEDDVAAAAADVAAAAARRDGAVILVSNEVGLGIVPENPAARRYRDLVGRCNQVIAGAADRAVFMVSGLPLVLKEG